MKRVRDAHWLPLAGLSLGDLPRLGNVGAAYMFRDALTEELLYIGSTDCLRRRLFGNHLGGVGGATTQRVNGLLLHRNRVARVQVAWFVTREWKRLEDVLKAEFRAEHDYSLPPGTLR